MGIGKIDGIVFSAHHFLAGLDPAVAGIVEDDQRYRQFEPRDRFEFARRDSKTAVTHYTNDSARVGPRKISTDNRGQSVTQRPVSSRRGKPSTGLWHLPVRAEIRTRRARIGADHNVRWQYTKRFCEKPLWPDRHRA